MERRVSIESCLEAPWVYVEQSRKLEVETIGLDD